MSEVEPPAMVNVDLNEDARFVFPQVETYWSVALVTEGHYEPEIDWLLKRAKDRPFVLLDAGANFGLWSIIASSTPYGRHPTVAIEPSQDNYRWLLRNADANANRFHTLRCAVHETSGRRVNLYGKKHYGLSLRTDWHPNDSDQFEEVETVSLDEVADRFFPNRSYPPLVKLDIEGAEIEGFKGARRLLAEGALFAYEDHGKQATHEISRFVLSLDDIAIWSVDIDKGPVRITGIDQVAAIKVNPINGYNFFACKRSSPWASVFESPIDTPRRRGPLHWLIARFS